jgi:hypothetical protein
MPQIVAKSRYCRLVHFLAALSGRILQRKKFVAKSEREENPNLRAKIRRIFRHRDNAAQSAINENQNSRSGETATVLGQRLLLLYTIKLNLPVDTLLGLFTTQELGLRIDKDEYEGCDTLKLDFASDLDLARRRSRPADVAHLTPRSKRQKKQKRKERTEQGEDKGENLKDTWSP